MVEISEEEISRRKEELNSLLSNRNIVSVTPSIEKIEGEPLKLDDLLEEKNVRTMRNYLRIRSSLGAGVDKYTDEEVRDMYMSRMRNFETSDTGIISESLFAKKQEGRNQQIVADAYMLYENLGNVFQSGSTWDAITGVGEHLGNMLNPLESPSTYLTAGAGRVATFALGKGARKLATQQVMKQAAQQGGTKATLEIAQREATKKFSKKAVAGGVATATALDVGSALVLDSMYQDTRMQIGVQEEFSALQSGLAALTGVLGGTVDLLSRARTTKLSGYDADKLVDVGTYKDYYAEPPEVKKQIHKKILENTRKWTDKVREGAEILEDVDGQYLKADFLKALFLGDGKEIKGVGQILREAGLDLNVSKRYEKGANITDILTDFIEDMPKDIEDEITKTIEATNIFNLLGIKPDNKKLSSLIASKVSEAGQELNIFSQLARQLRDAKRKGSKVYLQTLAEEDAELKKLTDGLKKTYDKDGNLIEIVADKKRLKWGRYFQNVWKRTVVAAFSTTVLNLKGFTGITAIKGMEDLAELTLRMSLASPLAAIKLAKGDKQGAISEFSKSLAIAKNNTQRLRNFLDPNATKEMYEAIMKIDSDSAFTLNRVMSAGIEIGDDIYETAKKYNFVKFEEDFVRDKSGKIISKEKKLLRKVNEKSTTIKYAENYVNAAQKIALVRVTDTFMKSQAYMGNLDRLIRSKNIKGTENLHKIFNLPKKELDEFLRSEQFLDMSAEATEQTLEDVFGKSYRTSAEQLESIRKAPKSNNRYRALSQKVFDEIEYGRVNTLGTLAGFIEGIGNYPLLGTILPFGKFLNNTLAITYDVIGGGAINGVIDLARLGKIQKSTGKKLKRGAVTGGVLSTVSALSEEDDDGPVQELFEDAIRGAANLTAIGIVMKIDREKMAKGLKWKDHVTDDGDITNIQYDFPYSLFAVGARYLNYRKENMEIPESLHRELVEQIGIGQLERNLGQIGNVTGTIKLLTSGEYQKFADAAGTGILTPISSQISGFSRPFDLPNRTLGYVLGEEAEAMDPRLGNVSNNPTLNRLVYDSTRYVNNFFEVLTGKQTAQSKRTIAEKGNIIPQNIVGDIAGFRAENPRTATDVMFSDIGLELWKAEQRIKSSFPEGDALYKEKIQPQLEIEARRLLNSTTYKNANSDQKQRLVSEVFSRVKQKITRQMEGNKLNIKGDERNTKIFVQIRNIYKAKSRDRKNAIKFVTGEDDLSIEELKALGESSQGRIILTKINRAVSEFRTGKR